MKAGRLVTRNEHYNIVHPHPDEAKLWQTLIARPGGHKAYHLCMSGDPDAGAGESNMPFHKETLRLGGQLSHWQHTMEKSMRRLQFSKPFKTAPAEENLLWQTVRRGAAE
ncbi:MAG: hypothetical protein M1826_002255 [Phylliscum demangeonii]|nr:MAG: hypothetical protein M1826_002255 [Phylliscum demangeonii]